MSIEQSRRFRMRWLTEKEHEGGLTAQEREEFLQLRREFYSD